MADERNFEIKQLKALQAEAVDILKEVGTLISYKKDIGKFADLMYKMQRRVPIINIEASLMGEKFGIVIGYPLDYQKVVRTDKFKIFHLTDIHTFRKEWNLYVSERLKK